MKQLTQKLKSGEMQILEVPFPILTKGQILVRNYYSLISAGTEAGTVKAARKGYIGKAKERPQQTKQVVGTLKTQGPVQTYRAVMKKLDAYSPLGYSCAGKVLDVAPDIEGIEIGDYVACGGLTANHAEIVTVPEKLCVKIDRFRYSGIQGLNDSKIEEQDKLLKAAAYNTLGAIAMQGVRQADLRLRETCAVIGLGLLGQLSALILKASGIRVLGIDIDQTMVDIAGKHCLDLALNREDDEIENRISEFTDGIGCDAVIITASSSSLDPINFAGAISRKKGTIVVVGDVPTGFDREPHYYKKELQVKMSCSYGPGRYDPNYEKKGIDYPPGYVRWTEKRNMEAFQELIFSKKIELDYLTTHTFKLEDAPAAYDMILERNEPFIGILIAYDPQIAHKKIITRVPSSAISTQPSVSIAFVGAGSYAQSYLLPNISHEKDVVLKGVMTSSGTSSRSVAERFNFEFCTSDENDIFENIDINTVFIATRHNSHADYVIKTLNAGKHVFVEKPLCLKEEELFKIRDTYKIQIPNSNSPTTRNGVPLLMVGYNRRFSPLAKLLKEKLGDGPMSMICRVNAGMIPADSWIQDPDLGGGRIIGEICHFVDFLTFVCGSLPKRVFAASVPDPDNFNDVVNISLKFENGSIGTISYFANGSRSLAKEYIEIYRAGRTGIIKDFKEIEIHGSKKPYKKKLMSQDKGQKSMLREFLETIRGGLPPPIPFEDIYTVSMTTFKILESIRRQEALLILE